MTTKEFSDNFDTILNSYQNNPNFGDDGRNNNIVLDEYEKSVFLTRAQNDIIISYYNGNNPYYDSFESSEEFRRYLNSLVETKEYDISEALDNIIKLDDKSKIFELPSNLAFITLEQITFDNTNGCYSNKVVGVHPVTQDEWANVKDNPFRGPTRYKALRIDTGKNNVEIISKYPFSKYTIKFLSKLEPIILTDLQNGLSIDGKSTKTECKLNSLLHNTILQRAVELAIVSKSIGKSSNV